MTTTKPVLEEVSGYLGVGALELLGGFFVLDGASGFLSFMETYAATNTWGILVTIPALVVAYVLGLFSSLGAEALLGRSKKAALTPLVFAFVASSNNAHLALRYADTERHARLLYGCTFAFLILAVGCLAEIRMMGEFAFVGYIGAICCLIAAVLCPLLAGRLKMDLIKIIDAFRDLMPKSPFQNLSKPSPLQGST